MRNDIDRRSALAVLASTMLAACGGGHDPTVWVAPAPASPVPPASAPSPGTDALNIGEWSAIATETVLAEAAARPSGLSPMEESRIYAMAFIAASDALNAINYKYGSYADHVNVPDANADAAIAAAVHAVLRDQLPNQAGALDAALVSSLSSLADGSAKTLGINLGQSRAQQILALRANDGSSNAQEPYTPGSAPGDYQPTAPAGVATFVNWGRVTPFALSSGSEFRAPPPYSIGDAAYAADFAEVKALGGASSTQRSADQTETAHFWLESPALSWQRMATSVSNRQSGIWPQLDGSTQAALFATLQMAITDSYIAALDSKYAFNFWRPSTAIHAADTDGNQDTVADADWEPLGPYTPQVPEYVSARAAAAMAGAKAMVLVFGPGDFTCTSTSLPGTLRRFNGFEAMAREVGMSRIYAGVNFRRAIEEGWVLGEKVSASAKRIYFRYD